MHSTYSNSLRSLLTRELPNYTGQHRVGVVDVEVPLEDGPLTFGDFVHSKLPDSPAGLSISTVMFSMFYPCQEGGHRAIWYPKLGATTDGFLRMANRNVNNWWRALSWPAAWLCVAGTTFSCYANAPILPAPDGKAWPVIIFSHGVGTSRLMYSQFCGEMASRGYVVAALEHRDGSGPSSTIISSDGTSKRLDWLSWKDIEWPNVETQPTDDTALRRIQLELRKTELAAAIDVLKSMAEGKRCALTHNSRDLSCYKGMFDPSRPILTGHSFGGTACIGAGADKRFTPSMVIVSDPACQRLGTWGDRKITVPYVTCNSEEWMRSKEVGEAQPVFDSATAERATFSVTGSTHPSYSDVFLIMPTFVNERVGLKALPQRVIRHYAHVVELVAADELEKLKDQSTLIAPDDSYPSTTYRAAGHLLFHQEKKA